MLAFWQNGYETTSVSQLTTAMAITAPALYSAFGDKRRLFLEAVRRYVGDEEAAVRAMDNAPTAYEAARLFLRAAATTFTGKNTPAGCMLASSTASGSEDSADVRAAVAALRRRMRRALERRLHRDVREGLLVPTVNVSAIAGMIMAVQLGLSVLARDGASRRDLMAIVEQTLEAWPIRKMPPMGKSDIAI